MSKRILVIGGVAGGASAAARARRLDEQADIIIFERGPHVSFSNCALPYFLSRTVADSADLVMMDPVQFKKKYNIEVRTEQEVTAINRSEKTVTVRNLTEGKEYTERYDVLILSPGGEPVMPAAIEGIRNENVFGIRNVVDIVKLDDYLRSHKATDVAVVGGGFIGCEIAENLIHAGYQVTLIETMDQVMTPFDFDMAQILHKEMIDKGITLILKDGVQKIGQDSVFLASGRQVKAQAVVMAVGIRPETALAKNAGLAIGSTGGIKVNANFQTSDLSIYAVGDAIEVFSRLTHKPMRLALAWPAQMEARAAADHIYGLRNQQKGFLGSSVIRIFDLLAASTGLNEKTAKAEHIPYETAYVIPSDKVSLMPDAHPIHLKVLFETPTGRLLGAQAIGKGEADRRIDVIAALISMNGTLEDLKNAELCYAPVVSTAKDATNMAALVGLNLLHGAYRQVPLTKVRELVETKACIIDVREPGEYNAGHLVNAVNIPLSQLRQRMDEIPKDRPVYLHCRSSQRSYNAVMALQHCGFSNVYNIAGSYLAICLYEYPQDVLFGREKIVTEYNFK
ncbi:MAG: FAD-dependent oxidoreductase [Acidaminococcaceae bacterium]|nr:FAD-dependent oxidoreductase [Acidaminococcaceae bacterium]